jgi:hypothetical protein
MDEEWWFTSYTNVAHDVFINVLDGFGVHIVTKKEI